MGGNATFRIWPAIVNWLFALGTLVAVLGFRSSDALGGAYGIAVSLLMAITTVLAALVALQWGYPPLAVLAVVGRRLLARLRPTSNQWLSVRLCISCPHLT
jgi:KUP system potassium uptake protein